MLVKTRMSFISQIAFISQIENKQLIANLYMTF